MNREKSGYLKARRQRKEFIRQKRENEMGYGVLWFI